MHPLVLLLLAILSPLLLTAALLIPPYIGVAAAAYIIYSGSAAIHPLSDKLLDVFYIIDVYSKLFSQWSEHLMDTPLLSYTLPLLMLPIMGIMLSIWLSKKLTTKLRDLFQDSVSY